MKVQLILCDRRSRPTVCRKSAKLLWRHDCHWCCFKQDLEICDLATWQHNGVSTRNRGPTSCMVTDHRWRTTLFCWHLIILMTITEPSFQVYVCKQKHASNLFWMGTFSTVQASNRSWNAVFVNKVLARSRKSSKHNNWCHFQFSIRYCKVY